MKCFNFVDAGSGAPPCSIACTMLANLATSPSKIRIFIIHMIMLSGTTDPWYRKVLEILQFVLSERYCCSETVPGLYFTLNHACIAYERYIATFTDKVSSVCKRCIENSRFSVHRKSNNISRSELFTVLYKWRLVSIVYNRPTRRPKKTDTAT